MSKRKPSTSIGENSALVRAAMTQRIGIAAAMALTSAGTLFRRRYQIPATPHILLVPLAYHPWFTSKYEYWTRGIGTASADACTHPRAAAIPKATYIERSPRAGLRHPAGDAIQ